MHFPHPSLLCWKDSSELPPHLGCYNTLGGSYAFKMSPLELGGRGSQIKQNQMNKEAVSIWQCSSQLGTTKYSERCEQVHCGGEAATILLFSCALSKAYTADLLIDWPGGKNSLWMMSFTSKNIINDLDCLSSALVT